MSSFSIVLGKFYKTKFHAKNHDFAHVILLFLDDQSTDQGNNSQAMFGWETKKVVILVLHEVQFFVILPLREKGQNSIFNHTVLKKQTLNIKYLLYSYSVYLLRCLPQAKKIFSV